MSKRYGRNQKRAHRARIASLETAVASSERRAASAEARARDAYARAVQEVANKGDYLDFALKRIAEELARSYPAALREAAEQILRSRRDTPPVRFDANVDPWAMERVVVLRGEIPALRYNIAVR